ncbi:TetR/AcrR family transcriptional regulator [Pelagibius litoralis]|uniref:TetR/AcrR family transcriptional regulator n=1 Tax=Pelagibius litoralis TaxID=374515 RepID=A0A967KBZ3_9PROT|nr:TetR/AcrR family transcriptional regulator [Pelagibius litoralis]NIA71382.1 TetR/AcrR family transcriptional regulator [Pelagibius litoralis]
MNDTKKVGRPKTFDRDQALLQAIGVFWKQGYEGASMKLLTDAMGINSPSLYAEFGDKHGLYLEAINRYANEDACAPLVALETESDIRKAVRAFFEAAIDYSTHHGSGAKGCFLASCVATSAGHIDGTAELLREAIKATDDRIAARFELEASQGTLPVDFPCRARAKLLFDLRQGLVFRARAGFTERELIADIEKNVAAVVAPAQSPSAPRH